MPARRWESNYEVLGCHSYPPHLQAAGEEGESKGSSSGNVERRSTRAWAQDSGYNTQKLFQKFFNDDIK